MKISNESRFTEVAEKYLWVLDSPAHGKTPQITDKGLYIQGWVLPSEGNFLPEYVAIEWGVGDAMQTLHLSLMYGRPDVIRRKLGVDATMHPFLKCGFLGYIEACPQDFKMGFGAGDAIVWASSIQILDDPPEQTGLQLSTQASSVSVVVGSEGWLFLDNDTNRSVDQHTGRVLLDEDKIEGWLLYFKETRALAARIGAKHAVVVAPSKEQILPEYYPHARAKKTVVDQVLSSSEPADHVVDSALVLRARPDREACLIKTDTHWTDLGARVVVLALLKELCLSAPEAEAFFAADQYHSMPYQGDLGVKCNPPVAAKTEFLLAPPVDADAVFDNRLPNMGRVLIYSRPEALWSQNLLMFGASSSYVMLKYLKRLFRRVVFVHSAASVDADVVEHEKPDFLVLQTTARFMIEVPHTAYSLRDTVSLKLKESNDQARDVAANLASKGSGDASNEYYLRMLGTTA